MTELEHLNVQEFDHPISQNIDRLSQSFDLDELEASINEIKTAWLRGETFSCVEMAVAL